MRRVFSSLIAALTVCLVTTLYFIRRGYVSQSAYRDSIIATVHAVTHESEKSIARTQIPAPPWLRALSEEFPLPDDPNFGRLNSSSIDAWRTFNPPTLAYDLFTSALGPMNLTYIVNDPMPSPHVRGGVDVSIPHRIPGGRGFQNLERKKFCQADPSPVKRLRNMLIRNYHGRGLSKKEIDRIEVKYRQHVDALWRMVPSVRYTFNQQAIRIRAKSDHTEFLQLNSTTLVVPLGSETATSAWMFFDSLTRLQVWPAEVIIVTLLSDEERGRENMVQALSGLLAAVEIFTCGFGPAIPQEVRLRWVLGSGGGGPMKARWVGAIAATTPIVSMFDSDDYLAPGAIIGATTPFIIDPHLDHLLGQYIWYGEYAEPASRVWQRHIKHFMGVMLRYTEELEVDWRLTFDRVLDYFRQPTYSIAAAHEAFVLDWVNTTMYYRPNTIQGWPNLAWSRYLDYWKYYEKRKYAYLHDPDLVVASPAEIVEAFQLLNKANDWNFVRVGTRRHGNAVAERQNATQGPLKPIGAHRQVQDERWLRERDVRSPQAASLSCHNGWITIRRDILDYLVPPLDVEFGEDSIFNMQISMSGLFNSVCLTSSTLGIYVPVGYSDDTLIVRRNF